MLATARFGLGWTLLYIQCCVLGGIGQSCFRASFLGVWMWRELLFISTFALCQSAWGHRGHGQPLQSRILLPPPASTHTAVSTTEGSRNTGRENNVILFFFGWHYRPPEVFFSIKLLIGLDRCYECRKCCCWLAFQVIQDQWFFASQEGLGHQCSDEFKSMLHSFLFNN